MVAKKGLVLRLDLDQCKNKNFVYITAGYRKPFKHEERKGKHEVSRKNYKPFVTLCG